MSHNWFIWQCLEFIHTSGEVIQSDVYVFSSLSAHYESHCDMLNATI